MSKELFVPAPLTVAEAAQKLSKSPSWVWQRIESGVIKHIRKGRNVYVATEEVNRINTEGCE